jgi:broad specificity phosphatase PhoE
MTEVACGAAERAFLSSLAGAWEAESRVRVAPDEYADARSTVESTIALGGCGLVSVHELTVDGSVRSEVHMLSADGEGRFELSAVDSEHGSSTVSSGRRDGDVLLLEWSRDLGDRELRTRKEYRVVSGDEYRLEHRLSPSEGDSWAVTFEGTFRRRASTRTVVYLVRHAEPSFPTAGGETASDPHLNLAGQERAHALRHMLEQAGITGIFSSDYNRTKETVAPLAEALELTVELYDPRAMDGLVDHLLHTAGRFVVAGHSNTTPALAELLGGDPGEPINENYEFDRLYQIVVDADGSVTTSLLRYGAVSGR